jgi:hypothetical protein
MKSVQKQISFHDYKQKHHSIIMYKIYAYLLSEIFLIFKSQIGINSNIMNIILSLEQLLMALGHLHKDIQAGHL